MAVGTYDDMAGYPAFVDGPLEAHESQIPRTPLLVVLFIAMFALTVLVFGTHPKLFRVPYYLGVISALVSAVVYFQYSFPIPMPAFYFGGWFFWSILTGLRAESQEATWLATTTIAQILVMVFVFATICHDSRSVWVIGAALALGAVLNAIAALVFNLNVKEGRAAGFAVNPNSAAVVYGMGMCILAGMTAATRSSFARLMLTGVNLFLMYATVMTGSRAGAVCLVPPILYAAWFYRRDLVRKPLVMGGIAVGLVVGAVALPAWLSETELGRRSKQAMLTLTGQASKQESSVTSRVEMKYKAIEVSLKNPIMGVGVGNFTPYVFRNEGQTLSTHDNFLDVLSGTGFPGFALYYATFAWLWFVSGRLKRSGLLTQSELAIISMTRTFVIFRLCWDFFENTGWTSKPGWMFLAVLAGVLTGYKKLLAERAEAYGLTPAQASAGPAGSGY